MQQGSGVHFRRFTYPWLAHHSYLIADRESGVAAVIDPFRDVDPYLEEAWRTGTAIRHILLTQMPGSFPSGHAELRARSGATTYIGSWARAGFDSMPVKDGDILEFGRVRLRIRETPGHVLEGLCIEEFDARGDCAHPHRVFVGRTLIDGDLGRPVPLAENGYSSAELAEMLHASLQGSFRTLPGETRLCPGHAARMQGGGGGEITWAGQQEALPLLRPGPKEAFVRDLTADMVESLEAWGAGRGEPMRAASLDEVLKVRRSGAQIVDFRDPADFSAAHLEGSLNLGLASTLEVWATHFLDPERPIVIVADPGREQEAARRVRRLGYSQVGAYLEGGIQALEPCPGELRQVSKVSVGALVARPGSGEPWQVLDLRGESGGRPVPGAIRLPLEELHERAPKLLPYPRLAVLADSVYRSSTAASFLRALGAPEVVEVAGAAAAWERWSIR